MSTPAFAPAGDSLRTWRLLSSEAHRMMFFFGALQAVAAMSWWLFDLGTRYVAVLLPFTPVGVQLGFVAPPALFFAVLAAMLLFYLLAVEQ